MHVFEFVIIIVVASFIFQMYKMKHQDKVESATDQEQDLKEEIELLKERVATLESIVTDKGYQLNKEIDEL